MIITPPIAKKLTKETKIHNHVLKDDYFWLRDKKNKEVIKYLNEENKYTDKIMSPTRKLQKKLFKEMKSRIKENDISVPLRIGDYYF